MAKPHHTANSVSTGDVKSEVHDAPATAQEVAKDVKAEQAQTAAVTEQPHEEQLIDNPHFWVGISFVMFAILALRYIMPKINGSLDARAAEIATQLQTANRLRAEAEALMEASRQQQKEMLKEADNILAQASLDVKELHAKAEADLAQTIIRRTAMADERITRAKIDAMQDLRVEMIETATATAREVMITHLQTSAEDPAITRALETIASKLH